MLDITQEEVLSLTEATKRVPRRRQGKRPNVATMYRWAQRGCKGVRLETIQVGGTKCTSVEALQRFFDRLSANAAAAPPAPVTTSREYKRIQVNLAREGLA